MNTYRLVRKAEIGPLLDGSLGILPTYVVEQKATLEGTESIWWFPTESFYTVDQGLDHIKLQKEVDNIEQVIIYSDENQD